MIAYLPMTKAAVRGLDTIENFVKEEYDIEIDGFFVAGGSKRGWVGFEIRIFYYFQAF